MPHTHTARQLFALMCCAMCGSAAIAAAQPPPPGSDDRPETPPLVWQPSFGLTGLGYDSNVFNLPKTTSGQQVGDWVASLAAGLAPVWTIGNARLAADTGVVYNYFRTFTQERGVDANAHARI